MSNPTPTETLLQKRLNMLNAAHAETVNKVNELSKQALRLEGAISVVGQMAAEEAEAAKQAEARADLAEETLADNTVGPVENDLNQAGE